MAVRLDITVRNLFPTPVAAVATPDCGPRNAALRQAILQRRAESASVQASNSGGWHSDRDILVWGGPAAAEVLALAQLVATRMTGARGGQTVSPAWRVSAWANVNGPGDANICHYHPGAFWSGTYYVDDGGSVADPDFGGQFEMLDPRGPAPAMYAPALCFAGEAGRSMGGTETIEPRPGLLFVFPSWLHHQVRAYRGTGLRISIAFNLGLAEGPTHGDTR